jgi:hypothetical protein
VVNDSFLSGAGWNLSTAVRNRQDDRGWDEWKVNPPYPDYQSIIEGMQHDVVKGIYERKNVSDCYSLYQDYWDARQGNVVVVVKNETGAESENDSLLLYTFVTPRYDNYAKNLWAAANGTGEVIAFSPAPPPVTTVYLGPPHYEASYCLVQEAAASAVRCRLEYSTHILYSVTALNFLKLLTLFFVWTSRKRGDRRRKTMNEAWGAVVDVEEQALTRRETVLSTLGDAVASFMQEPDETTKNMCLAAKYDFLEKRRFWKRQEKEEVEAHSHPRKWAMSHKRWMSAVTFSQWTCMIFL